MPDDINAIITSYRENLEYKAKDEDLLLAINKAILESKDLKEKIDRQGETNKRIWTKGTEKDLTRFHPKKARITSNRVFTDVETAIPILTSQPPEPTVIGNVDNDIQTTLQKGLTIAYEVKYKMQQKLQCLIRHWFLFRIGVLKYRWDKEKGFMTENVLPRKIGFDKRATSKENCEYMWEEIETTVEFLIAKFPKKEKEIKDSLGKADPKSKVKYTEFWGGNGKWLCWKLNNIILGKKKNPNWNYDDETNNIFDKPEFPYLLINVFAFGDETGLYDETSLVEQGTPLQEGVNQLEQQILDLNEGQKRVWVALGRAMSEEKAQDLINKTGDLLVYVDRNGLPGDVSQVQSGKPDASLFNHLAHLLAEIDNTIGIHPNTRGERKEQETLGGRQLLLSSDYGRLDLIVRNVEQVMEEWYNAYLQMLKVYADQPEMLSNGKETIKLKPEEIPSDIMIMVKKGSTLPIDARSKMANAIQLAGAGMIDPGTLFEEMSYPNVEKRVQDLYAWLQATGKIMPQQPQMPAGGQLGAPQGQETGDQQKLQQIQRVRQMLEQVRQMPPEQQEEMAGKVNQAAQMIAQ